MEVETFLEVSRWEVVKVDERKAGFEGRALGRNVLRTGAACLVLGEAGFRLRELPQILLELFQLLLSGLLLQLLILELLVLI